VPFDHQRLPAPQPLHHQLLELVHTPYVHAWPLGFRENGTGSIAWMDSPENHEGSTFNHENVNPFCCLFSSPPLSISISPSVSSLPPSPFSVFSSNPRKVSIILDQASSSATHHFLRSRTESGKHLPVISVPLISGLAHAVARPGTTTYLVFST
jgi:hypothetical protein